MYKTILQIRPVITLEQICRANPRMIWYGAQTCWWTHDERDFYFKPNSGLPRDPRGGVLYIAGDAKEFVKIAMDNEDRYGLFKLNTFMSCHNKNSFTADGERHTCSASWDDYNQAFAGLNVATPTDLIGNISFIRAWIS